jgi:hypothetical protein
MSSSGSVSSSQMSVVSAFKAMVAYQSGDELASVVTPTA